ncbi:MAG TPA: tetratricopeptide repeat protein, partial [Planctomycetaceae bacterium]|nr:tetratricopeptide repeat protein [Planctomycetaceae bacterium]
MKAIVVCTAALVAGLGASWCTWHVYQTHPLLELPDVDLSAAPTAVKTAIQNARKAVVAAPRSGTAWGELGLSLRAHKFDREANLCLVRAMRFDPREITWPYVRGSSLSLRDRPEAERCFRIAASLRPDLALPRLRLAELYLEQRRLDEAKSELDAAIKIEPESARAMLALAQVAFARGELDAARKWAEDSFARDSTQRTTVEVLLRI